MQDEHEQQEDASRPDNFGIGLEEMAVAVDGLRAQKNLQIACEMADDEEEHHETGHGHYVFFAE